MPAVCECERRNPKPKTSRKIRILCSRLKLDGAADQVYGLQNLDSLKEQLSRHLPILNSSERGGHLSQRPYELDPTSYGPKLGSPALRNSYMLPACELTAAYLPDTRTTAFQAAVMRVHKPQHQSTRQATSLLVACGATYVA